MDATLKNFLLSQVALLPAVAGLIKFKKMDPAYRPFVWICLLAVLSEWVRFILIKNQIYNNLSYNIYALLNGLAYVWFFVSVGLFNGGKKIPQALALLLILIWIVDHFFLNGNSIKQSTIVYRLVYLFTLCLMASSMLYSLIVSEKKKLYKNPLFLICCGVVVFYVLSIIVVLFTNVEASKIFLKGVSDIRVFINPIIYCLFFIAILCFPTKKSFSIQF